MLNIIVSPKAFNSKGEKHIKKIVKFLKPLKNIKAVKVLPYHNYAGSKYEALGMKNTLPQILPTEEEIEKIEERLSLY